MPRLNRRPLCNRLTLPSCFIAFLLSSLAWSATAETIKIPVGQQSAGLAVTTPNTGMTMDQVVNRFGEPAKRFPSKGEPAITRWDFERFVVYIENKTVIHSVIKHQKSAQ